MTSYPTHVRARRGCQAGGGAAGAGRGLVAGPCQPPEAARQLRLDERALDVRCPPSSCTVKSLRHRGRAEVSRAQGARRRAFGACLGGANARASSAGRPVPCRAQGRHRRAGCCASVLCGHVAACSGCADACRQRPMHPYPTPCPKNPGPHALDGRAVAAAAWHWRVAGRRPYASPSGVPLTCCRLGLIQIVRDHAGKASHMHSGPKGL